MLKENTTLIQPASFVPNSLIENRKGKLKERWHLAWVSEVFSHHGKVDYVH